MIAAGAGKPKTAANSPRRTAGFTLIELLIVIAIVAIISAISYPVYHSYIDKAKVTLGISSLETTRKALEEYHDTYGGYPQTIDFATGLDGSGKTVLNAILLDEIHRHLFAVDSYIEAAPGYTLQARAVDSNHTILVLTPKQVVTQGS